MSGWEASYRKLLFTQDENSIKHDFEVLTSLARNLITDSGKLKDNIIL